MNKGLLLEVDPENPEKYKEVTTEFQSKTAEFDHHKDGLMFIDESLLKEKGVSTITQKITFYVITCNGTISQQAYGSLKEAQDFCKNRADKPKSVGNGWCYQSDKNIYVITDVVVERRLTDWKRK